jgi:hypothetical protein
MRNWPKLNTRGRIIFCLAIFNCWVAIVLAAQQDPQCLFSLFVGMTCGLSTFRERCAR